MAQERKRLSSEALTGLLGGPLNEALLRYFYSETLDEINANRLAFVEEIVNALESDNHDAKVEAVDALLRTLDAKMAGILDR